MKGKNDLDGKKVHEQPENKIVITKDSSLISYQPLNMESPKKGKKLWRKILIGFFCILLISLIGIVAFSKHILGYVNYKDFSNKKNKVIVQEEKFDTDGSSSSSGLDELDPKEVKWNNGGEIKKVEGVTNLLFIAEEKEEDEIRGRSDVIIIVTINTKDNTLKLTSILKDTYVQIPGYQDNRINSAYRTGDIPLLEKTIEQNFNIQVDGYIKVDFDGFSDLIDALGGVEVTLTKKEAKWLNEGNHILDEDSRNLKSGKQRLNGAQALGYARICKVPTVNGQSNDYGRTWRQKAVVSSVFNDYKNQSLTDMVALAPKVLSLITSDLTESKILSLAMTAIDLKVDQIETLSIPIKDSYETKSVRNMAVLVPNLEENISAIDAFLYGSNFDAEDYLGESIDDYQSDFSVK